MLRGVTHVKTASGNQIRILAWLPTFCKSRRLANGRRCNWQH